MTPESTKKTYFSLFLLSLSLFLYEILVVRVYSIFYLQNQLYLIYSTAVFGIGLGGIIAYYRPPQDGKPGPFTMALYPLGLAICLTYITNYHYLLPSGVNVIITALPFVTAGYIMSSFYRLWSHDANRVFMFDLLGGALGCLLSLPLVQTIGVPHSLAAIVLFATSSALVFYARERRALLISATAFALALCFMAASFLTGFLEIGQESLKKAQTPIGWMLNYKRMQADLVDTRWDIYSRVDLLETKADLSSKTMYINGGTEAVMLADNPDREAELAALDRDLLFFPYRFDDNEKVLVLGAGGGRDVRMALLAGAKNITAVEINKGVVDLTNENKEYTGDIFGRPEVKTVVCDGRTFVMRDTEKYDRIVLSLASTYAFTDVASISQLENYLYTQEAFGYYFDRLKPNGTLTIFIDYKELAEKFIVTALSYFQKEHGIKPMKGLTHIVAVGDPEVLFVGYSYAMMIKKTPYKMAALSNMNDYISERRWQKIVLPYNTFEEKYQGLAEGKTGLAKLMAESTNNLTPPTDDNPYFLEVVMNFRYMLTFFSISIGLIIFFLWSLYYQRLINRGLLMEDAAKRRALAKFSLLVPYFTLCGIGSFLVEITLTKIFSYYLGYPQLNMAVILFGLLVGLGLGSLWAARLKEKIFYKIGRYCLILTAILLIMVPLNKYLLAYTISLPLIVRSALVVLYLFPATFLMGIPFATALRSFSDDLASEVPWMWGINGVASLLGSVLAVVISMVLGISYSIFIGAAVYLTVALLAFALYNRYEKV